MKKALEKMLSSVRGAIDIIGVVVDVALVSALIPVLVVFINQAKLNLTASEGVMLGLLTLFIVIALVINVGRQGGIIKSR